MIRFTIILAGFLLIGLFSCSDAKDQKPILPVARDVLTIKWCSVFSDRLTYYKKDEIAEILKEKLGVDFTPIGSRMGINFSLYRGYLDKKIFEDKEIYGELYQLPDVFLLNPNWGFKWVEKYCTEITPDEIRRYMPIFYTDLTQLWMESGIDSTKKWNQYLVDDKLYIVPIITNSKRDFYPRVNLWRKDILDELGKSVPKTIDDWKAVLSSYLTLSRSNKSLNFNIAFDNKQMDFLFSASGVSHNLWGEMGSGLFWLRTQDEIKESLRVFQDWYGKKIIVNNPTYDSSYKSSIGDFIYGKNIVATGVHYEYGNWICEEPYWPGSIQAKCKVINPEAEFVISPPLIIQGDEKPVLELSNREMDLYIVFGKHLEQDREKLHKIMMLLDKMASDPELFLLTNLGIEGKDWVWDKVDGKKYPKSLSGLYLPAEGTDRHEEGFSDYVPFWSLVYSEKNSELLIHPRIRESIQKIIFDGGAPYSEENTSWNYEIDCIPYFQEEVNYSLSIIEEQIEKAEKELFYRITTLSKDVDETFENYVKIYNTPQLETVLSRLNFYYKKYGYSDN